MGLFSFVTDFFTGGQQGAANDAAQRAVDVISGAKLPDVDAMKLSLEKYVQQGVLTPEMANTILQNDSEMKGISTDPRLKNAQLAALGSLQDIADNKGLTVADKAALNQISSEENARERGQREAILQNAQQRGIGGSGLELAAQLANQQGSATRASQRGFDVAAEAQRRALEAILQSGQLSGQMRSQDFNEQAQIAAAQDAINRFNAANQNTTMMANIAAKNAAAETNLSNQQNIANANVGLSNQQQQYNKELLQQQYQNEMQKRQAQANAYTNQANNYQNSANRTSGITGGLIGAGAQLLFPNSGIGDFFNPNKKTQ